ncbi:MAG: MraY family glycosyltransferase [Thermoplasmatota archaeon]
MSDLLGLHIGYRGALALGFLASFSTAAIVTPRAISKLRGAGIVARDRHKPDLPEIAEMGGLAVFLAFNVGAFAILGSRNLEPAVQVLVLASLVVCAGACITGILDDLISLRQRFKAVIPLAFAAPLAVYVESYQVTFPFVGVVDFRLLYPLLLVPLGIAFASNAFNMLEGFNGLGAGLGIALAMALGAMAVLSGNLAGLAILVPMVGALAAFLFYNAFPARVFPGDTMTLLVGASLACGAILSKLEFWVALLMLPHFVEFALKASASFKVQSFADRVDAEGHLFRDAPVRSLTHVPMKIRPGISERGLVRVLWGAHAAYCGVVLCGFLLAR